jgi:hypothetical protein
MKLRQQVASDYSDLYTSLVKTVQHRLSDMVNSIHDRRVFES